MNISRQPNKNLAAVVAEFRGDYSQTFREKKEAKQELEDHIIAQRAARYRSDKVCDSLEEALASQAGQFATLVNRRSRRVPLSGEAPE